MKTTIDIPKPIANTSYPLWGQGGKTGKLYYKSSLGSNWVRLEDGFVVSFGMGIETLPKDTQITITV